MDEPQDPTPPPDQPAAEHASLPPSVAAAAAKARLPEHDPLLRVFREIVAEKDSALARSEEVVRQVRTVAEALIRSGEAQRRLLEERVRAAARVIGQASATAERQAARAMARQAEQASAAVSAEIRRKLDRALRDAAAADRRGWRDRLVPPLVSGLAAGVVLAALLGAGWWLWAGPVMERAAAFDSVMAAYQRLSDEQRKVVDAYLWGERR